jgi:hypothetical protein
MAIAAVASQLPFDARDIPRPELGRGTIFGIPLFIHL